MSNDSLAKAAPKMLAALLDVQKRIKESDSWWMNVKDRGGFDEAMIDAAIAEAHMSKHPTLEHPVIQMELRLSKLDLEWVQLASKSIKESHAMIKRNSVKYTVHVAAIVKGVIEHDDATRHFGSTLGYKHHLNTAIEEGLVTLEEAKHREGFTYLKETVTALGRAVYKQQGWDKLKDTRANSWSNFSD